MLGSLTGTVTASLGSRILVEVAGVGYWVHTGSWQPTGEVTCFLHHHIREEASDLYGFSSLDQLVLFEKLLSVSGIGPKAALAILSLGDASVVSSNITEGNTTFLALAPGVGKRAAEKIVLELAGKLVPITGSSTNQELRDALSTLGYADRELTSLLSAIPSEIGSKPVDEQLRWALRELQKR
jgi:Holliday junction DNA helicase RuvA